MGSTIFLEQDLFKGCRIIFDKTEYTVSADFYNKFESFLNDNAKVIKSLNDKVENQRKELSSLLAKNKKLEEENQKLRDINNKNFWPNGKAPVVDFPVLQYDSIPSWFDFTFTHFRYDSRRTLNLPGKITIEGVSDDHKKIDAFVEHGDVFSGIFSICRMSDIKDLVDKYNALVVDNRHLELEKISALDSLALVETNLKGIRKKVEVAEGEYEKMKEVLKRWHEATSCNNFDQARKLIEKLRKENSCIPFGCELAYKTLEGRYKDSQNRLKKRDEEIDRLAKEIQELKDDKEGRRTLIQYKNNRIQAENRLIEECSELIQAIAKRKRTYACEVNYIGGRELTELAHVIISAIVYCKNWDVSNELLQKAVQVKYPEPYEDYDGQM